MPTTPTLTFRQERFALEYLKDQNASAAAARAGYTARNMASQGNELMSNPAVRERVRREMQDLLAELRVSTLELMKQRARAAFFRCDRLFREGWEPLTLQELDEETLKALEVTTVLRKSGLVTRVKQPCRDKALRALERVHERMDKLNEQYWAKLEKEGLVPSLEEIDRMDGGGVQGPAVDFSQKPQVLSGSGEPGRNGGEQICEKPQVLSGLGVGAKTKTCEISEKDQVLSGREQAVSIEGRDILEKPQVLSGSQAVEERPRVRWPAELLAQLPGEKAGTERRRGLAAA